MLLHAFTRCGWWPFVALDVEGVRWALAPLAISSMACARRRPPPRWVWPAAACYTVYHRAHAVAQRGALCLA